ncbi:MAG: DUF2071 domain-containing protein [Dehalococcoidia bacterium]
MLLNNVVYVSYMLPAKRILPLVPDKLSLALVDGEKAFLSIVILRCRDVHLASFPFPRFDYYQLNVRTYVIDPYTGNQAVYFLKSGVTALPISTATRVFGLSWQHIKLTVETENGIRPLIGFYRWGTGMGRFEIRHPEVYPVAMHLNTFHFRVPGESDLLGTDELLRPHSVLFVPEALFSIYLPPEKMDDK